MDIREKIAEMFAKTNDGDCPLGDDYHCIKDDKGELIPCAECITKHIFSLETDTERIAVVLKEPEFPPYRQCNHYEITQRQDMLEARFVQELKEGKC